MRILYFTAKWCTACPGTRSHVIAICKEKNVVVEEIDVDERSDDATYWNIFSLPTILAVNESYVELARHTGGIAKQGMLEFIHGVEDFL